MTDAELRTLLESARTIAVVGASTNPDKPSNHIPDVLIHAGFEVIPIHPSADQILGKKAYPTLADVPVKIDIVDVFRPPAETPGIAEQAASVGATAVWLQEGIASKDAAKVAEAAGLTFVEDLCIGATVKRLGVSQNRS